jgi:hypothetical protein
MKTFKISKRAFPMRLSPEEVETHVQRRRGMGRRRMGRGRRVGRRGVVKATSFKPTLFLFSPKSF